MSNGPDKGEENLAAFVAWAKPKKDDDLREYIYRENLSRKEIAAECGFGKSALGQNPRIAKALGELEDGLRERGVLPPRKAMSEKKMPSQRDLDAPQRRRDSQRLNALEQQNAALVAKLAAAEAKLEQYNLLDEMLTEAGRLPR